MPRHTLDDARFNALASLCLERVQAWLEDFDPDELDYRGADGVLKLEFADGQVFVLNRQAGNHQMWLAAGVRAWHYDWDGQDWRDDRDGHELFENLSKLVSEKLGRSVQLTKPTGR
jgi:CyaY protein